MVEVTVKAGHHGHHVHTRVDGWHKVGDFGLATSSLAVAVEPSELTPHTITVDAEMTLGSSPISGVLDTSHYRSHRGWDQTVHRTGSAITKKRPAKSYQGRFV